LLVGGELFTGNTMYMTIGLVGGGVSVLELLKNWILSLVGNYIGVVTLTGIFGYLTDFFVDEPFLSFIITLAEFKVTGMGWGVVFARAIIANMLVCIAIFIATAATTVGDKILGMAVPIFTFVSNPIPAILNPHLFSLKGCHWI